MRVGEWVMRVDGPLSGGLTGREIRRETGVKVTAYGLNALWCCWAACAFLLQTEKGKEGARRAEMADE